MLEGALRRIAQNGVFALGNNLDSRVSSRGRRTDGSEKVQEREAARDGKQKKKVRVAIVNKEPERRPGAFGG